LIKLLSSADGLSVAAEAGCVMRMLLLMKMPTEDAFVEKTRRVCQAIVDL